MDLHTAIMSWYACMGISVVDDNDKDIPGKGNVATATEKDSDGNNTKK